jgi:hypothetical protein
MLLRNGEIRNEGRDSQFNEHIDDLLPVLPVLPGSTN